METVPHPPPDSGRCARWGKECHAVEISGRGWRCKEFDCRLEQDPDSQAFYPARCKACWGKYGIILEPYDLKPRFQKKEDGREGSQNRVQAIPTEDIGFDHLDKDAQEKVRSHGRATFVSKDHKTSKVIFPPKSKPRS